MAVVDDLGHSGMDVPPPSDDFGRQPPQDAAAEHLARLESAQAGKPIRASKATSIGPPIRTSTTQSWTCTAAASRRTR